MTDELRLNEVYLLLGSNEGDRQLWFKKALEQITQTCGIIKKQSSLYETAAWGIEEQPDFLNMVICIETNLAPIDLLHATQNIENTLGRQRAIKWGQRTLDIDILFYGTLIMNVPELIIPHPFLQERRFTLAPLCELGPEMIHPVLHETIKELLDVCPDPLVVNRLNRDL